MDDPIKKWNAGISQRLEKEKKFKEMMKSGRPKMIHEYEENGHMVHVYEARHVYL